MSEQAKILGYVILLVVCALMFGFFMGILFAKAVDAAELADTATLMRRVERVLIDAGYGRAEGYGKLTPPAVFLTDDPLPRGDWGWSVPGTVLLSSAQPEACLRITLAHELAHDATRRRDLLDADFAGAPAWLLKDEMERIASLVETAVADDVGGYAPNCLMRKGVS